MIFALVCLWLELFGIDIYIWDLDGSTYVHICLLFWCMCMCMKEGQKKKGMNLHSSDDNNDQSLL